MNRLLSCAATLAVLAATACQKNDATPQPEGLVGEWTWVVSRGGLTGNQTYTPASTGNSTRWVFRADSTWQVFATRQGAAQPVQTGTYAVGTARSIYSGQPARSLTLRLPAASRTYVITELGSQLVLADNNPDGFTDTYQRQ